MKTAEGNLCVMIVGVPRPQIEEFVEFEQYLRAKISVLADEKEDESGVDFQALRRTVISQFERIIKLSPQLPDDLQTIVINIDDSGRLRSEEHTSELQSQSNLVCRLLLEKKKKKD